MQWNVQHINVAAVTAKTNRQDGHLPALTLSPLLEEEAGVAADEAQEPCEQRIPE